MRALIITVAGMSTRFGESLGKDMLKCVYCEDDASCTLLGRLLGQTESFFDQTIVVGGYRFGDLESYLGSRAKLTLIRNDHYTDLGSGWSLKLGIDAIKGGSYESVLFVEGDLYLDHETLTTLSRGCVDAVTLSPDPVEADKSVALYFDASGCPRYVYDVGHSFLTIPEPFSSVYTSGQVWRFGDPDRLIRVSEEFAARGGGGTNLEIIGPYFERANPELLEVARFETWVNCNTIEDWRRAFCGG